MNNAKWKRDKIISVGLVIAALLLVGTVLITLQVSKSLIEVSENLQKSYIALLKFEEIYSNLKEAESGVRGYVITGREIYLEPYYDTIKTIKGDIKDVRKLIPDNPIRQARIDEVESLISERLAILQESKDLRTGYGFEEAQELVMSGRGMTVMENLRDAISEIEADEYELLNSRLERQRKVFRHSISLNASVIFLAFIFAGFAYVTIKRDLTRRRQVEENLKESLTELSRKRKYEGIVSTITQSIHKSGNLRVILENAVESMSKNIDRADFFSFYIIEGEEAVLKANRGHTAQYIERASRIPYPKGITWKTIIEGQTIYVPDVDKDEVFGPAGRKMGIKSHLSVPIKYGGSNVGCASIGASERRKFGEDEFRLLEVVANQIEIAISNVKQRELLRQSEERYRTLFDQSPLGVYIFDNEFKITHCNERFVQILKTSRDKIIGINIKELKDPCVLPLMEKVFQGHTETYDGFYESTAGSAKLWVSIRLSPLRDEAGNVLAGMAVVEDITERKQADMELQARERFEQALVELGQLALRGSDLTTLMSEAVSLLAKILGVEYAKILELQADGNSLVLKAGVGWKQGYLGHELVGVGTESQGGYTIFSNDTVIVSDFAEETRFTAPLLLKAHSVASGISTTIYGKERPYGVLGAHSVSRRSYTKDEIHFLQSVANIVSEAIERNTVEEELRITNEIFAAINESSELDDVFKIAIEKVRELTDIDIVGIYLVDENSNEAVLEAHRGYPDIYVKRAGRIPYPRGVTWNVINSGEVYVVQDVSTDPLVGPVARESGFHSILSAPIKVEDRTIGAIHFHSNKKGKFGNREIQLFSSIGNQIALAVSKAKHTRDLKLINEDISALNLIATSIHKSLDLKEVYRVALDAVLEQENVDMAIVYLVDEKTNEAVIQAQRNLPEDYLRRASRIPYPRGITWKVINTGSILNIEDAQKDPQIGPAGRELGHHSLLGIPILQDGKGIGIIWFLSYKERKFNEREVNLFSTIGNQIATAITKAKLYQDLKDTNEKLMELEQMKDEFISIASHELRTPLSAIRGFISMLLEGDYGSLSPEAVEALEDITTATKRLIGLTNYLLDVSRIEQGRLEFKISDFEIGEVFDKVITDLQPIALEKGLKMEYQTPSVVGTLLVSADRFRVEQIVVNLIGNALKFTERGGVVITHRSNASHIITDVNDTGIGIAEKDQELLFQKFRAVQHSLSGDYKGGTGLGLYISKLFLNEMGGDVWLEKSELGQGSTFSFSLPKVQAQLELDRDRSANIGWGLDS